MNAKNGARPRSMPMALAALTMVALGMVAVASPAVADTHGPIEIDDSALSDASVVGITGNITCDEGHRFRVEVMVSQGETAGEGVATGTCTGGPQRFRAVVEATSGPGFEDGAAQVDAAAEIGDPRTRQVVDTFGTTEEVEIDIDPMARCISELAQAGFTNTGNANVILGTAGDDMFIDALTEGVDIVCGFGGNDLVRADTDTGPDAVLREGDVFLGGAGDDTTAFLEGGTFDGGDGIDSVDFLEAGTFNGGSDNDRVGFVRGGTFNGGAGNDSGIFVDGGTFNGEAGDDSVIFLQSGTFNGGPGNDTVAINQGGTFNQD